jgi:hypothetical protein
MSGWVEITDVPVCIREQVRSMTDVEGADELCVPCPPLMPMWGEGQATCAAYEHTQWFDASIHLKFFNLEI